ncbi:hypothetical protein IPM19_04340 [bacterium]|nr:MAG: hypothetical protein IPM19_04340 [bacterium]
MMDNNREFKRAERVDGRKESTTVNDQLYDVVKLEQYLTDHEQEFPATEIPLSDELIQSSVSEGNYYWGTKDEQKLGPHDFIVLWESYKESGNSDVDEFLESLKNSHPNWIVHIESIQRAANNLENPIWIYGDKEVHSHPFDGMHRLTRAILEGRESIKAIVWNSLPDEAKIDQH